MGHEGFGVTSSDPYSRVSSPLLPLRMDWISRVWSGAPQKGLQNLTPIFCTSGNLHESKPLLHTLIKTRK